MTPLEQLRDAVSALTGPLTLSPFDDPATVADWTMAIYRCRFKPEVRRAHAKHLVALAKGIIYLTP